MSVASRGIRNAFRNATRTISIVLILGLAIGLAFVMLTAHHSVTNKIASMLSSVGNTVNIGPPGYSAGGLLGKFLTTAELAPIAHLHGVTSLDEYFNGAAIARDSTQNDTPKGTVVHGSGGSASPIKQGSGGGAGPVKQGSGGSAGPVKQGSTSLKYPREPGVR